MIATKRRKDRAIDAANRQALASGRSDIRADDVQDCEPEAAPVFLPHLAR